MAGLTGDKHLPSSITCQTMTLDRSFFYTQGLSCVCWGTNCLRLILWDPLNCGPLYQLVQNSYIKGILKAFIVIKNLLFFYYAFWYCASGCALSHTEANLCGWFNILYGDLQSGQKAIRNFSSLIGLTSKMKPVIWTQPLWRWIQTSQRGCIRHSVRMSLFPGVISIREKFLRVWKNWNKL